MRVLVFILLLFFACSTNVTHFRSPASTTNTCYSLAQLISEQITAPRHFLDSSVELEIGLFSSEHTMPILTTTDGTIGPLLGNNPAPQWLQDLAGNRPVTNIPWDELRFPDKLQLIQFYSDHRGVEFFTDRQIHGLKVRDLLELNFSQETSFLGKTYPPGRHMVDVSRVFGKVEYQGPDDLKRLRDIELHFRYNSSAGEVALDALKFLDAVRINKPGLHVHIVAKVPFERLHQDATVEAMRLGEFFRRSNLAAEFIDLVHHKMNISSIKDANIVYFDSMNDQLLSGVTQYFLDLGAGIERKIGDDFKMSWIGMHGLDKYDQPGLWGLQVRSLPEGGDPVMAKKLLDGLQERMTGDYGVSGELMGLWFEHNRRPSQVANAIGELWYNRPWEEMLNSIPDELKRIVDDDLINKLQQAYPRHYEVKMLLHNWSNDPLLFNNPSLKRKIIEQQVKALKQFQGLPFNESWHIHSLMRETVAGFVEQSGLYDLALKAVGVR